MWVLSTTPASCHPSGIWNFEVVPTFFENSWTLALGHDNPLPQHQPYISDMYQDLCSLMCIKICSCTANVITLATIWMLGCHLHFCTFIFPISLHFCTTFWSPFNSTCPLEQHLIFDWHFYHPNPILLIAVLKKFLLHGKFIFPYWQTMILVQLVLFSLPCMNLVFVSHNKLVTPNHIYVTRRCSFLTQWV